MNTFRDNVVRVLLILASIFYLVGIILVGVRSLNSPNEEFVYGADGKQVLDDKGAPITKTASPPEIPPPLLGMVTAIGTALAVHAGKELGIPSDDQGDEAGGEPSAWAKFINSNVWLRLKEILTSIWKGFDPENIPKIATVVYLVGLLLAVVFFLFEQGSSASAELLQSSWTSLIGFFAGAWAIKTD